MTIGDRDYYNDEEVDFLFDAPLCSEIDQIKKPMPYAEEITCRLFLYNIPKITSLG